MQLSTTVPTNKTFLPQISNAYKLGGSMRKESDENMLRPRVRWSHGFRPLPFERGYFPVEKVTKAVLKAGFRGWFSYKDFDGGLRGWKSTMSWMSLWGVREGALKR